MNKLNWIFALLMLATGGIAHACTRSGDMTCVASALLAEADSEKSMRYREPDEGEQQGPLTVHVTTFDGSPTTPGMWYERARGNIEDENLQQQPVTPRAPFDRH